MSHKVEYPELYHDSSPNDCLQTETCTGETKLFLLLASRWRVRRNSILSYALPDTLKGTIKILPMLFLKS